MIEDALRQYHVLQRSKECEEVPFLNFSPHLAELRDIPRDEGGAKLLERRVERRNLSVRERVKRLRLEDTMLLV